MADAQSEYEDRLAYLKPLADLIASPAFTEVAGKLADMRTEYRDDQTLGVHVQALADIMPRLTWALGTVTPSEPVQAIAPVAPAQGSTDTTTTGEQPSS